MSMRLRAARRATQPLGWPRIDWSNPLTRGLKIAINGAAPWDAARRMTPGLDNSASVALTPFGQSLVFDGSTTKHTYNSSPITSGDVTCLALFNVAAGISGAVTSITGDSADSGIEFLADAGGNIQVWTASGGGDWANFVTTSGSVTSGKQHDVLYTYVASSGAVSIYVNDEAVTSGTATAGLADVDRVLVGGFMTGGILDDILTGGVQLVLYWSRILSGAEIASIKRNPWQVFAPVITLQQFKTPSAYVPTYGTHGQWDKTLLLDGWFGELAGINGWYAVDFMAPAAAGGTVLKYWTGSAWVAKPLKRWNGSSWVAATLKRRSGAGWV